MLTDYKKYIVHNHASYSYNDRAMIVQLSIRTNDHYKEALLIVYMHLAEHNYSLMQLTVVKCHKVRYSKTRNFCSLLHKTELSIMYLFRSVRHPYPEPEFYEYFPAQKSAEIAAALQMINIECLILTQLDAALSALNIVYDNGIMARQTLPLYTVLSGIIMPDTSTSYPWSRFFAEEH